MHCSMSSARTKASPAWLPMRRSCLGEKGGRTRQKTRILPAMCPHISHRVQIARLEPDSMERVAGAPSIQAGRRGTCQNVIRDVYTPVVRRCDTCNRCEMISPEQVTRPLSVG
jgi:hypothetical protein